MELRSYPMKSIGGSSEERVDEVLDSLKGYIDSENFDVLGFVEFMRFLKEIGNAPNLK